MLLIIQLIHFAGTNCNFIFFSVPTTCSKQSTKMVTFSFITVMCIHFNGIKYHTFLLAQRVCLRNWNFMMMLNELVMSHIVSLLWHTGSYSGFVIDFDFKLWIHITSKSLIRIPLWKLLFDTLCRDYGMTVSSYERYIYMSKKIKFLLWHCQYHWRHYIL